MLAVGYFMVLGVWSWSFGEPLQGAPGCLGSGARIPHGILELAGWVVSRFGQGLVKAAG
jgi:hypothetical protein